MKNLLCVSTIFVIHAFLHLTNAGSYSQSYERNSGHGYPDESGSYVTNFGNGQNKHNVVHMNESPDGLSISGTSYSKDRGGNPSVQKINVNFNEPNYNGGSQGPNVRYNPRGRTQITNIGNGEGNKNMFVFNDNRHDQDGNTGYHRESSNGYQGNTRSITNIGKGPDNDNRFYFKGKRVYPNAGRRDHSYRSRNHHYKRLLRKNVRNMMKNPLDNHYRRSGWRRTVKKLLHRRYH